jgi:penicillin-binding protein 1C
VKTTIEIGLQNRVNQIAKYYYNQYKQNEVHNLAILVIDVSKKSDELCGNVDNANMMSILSMPRSTGSILKPLLYAGMLDDGSYTNTLVADIPTQMRLCTSIST